ncbi:MAG TPA: hypothetical protein VK687_04145 [Bryobacteraceae bacterium]|jgi:hypothetical protein|nr:hypothetical protein [Bryobacteraceae bacterium]
MKNWRTKALLQAYCPELAAGIRRVKGVKQLGVRLGNWLTAEEGRALVNAPTAETSRAGETVPCLPPFWAAVFVGPNWFIFRSSICSAGENTGRLPTSLEKVGTFG